MGNDVLALVGLLVAGIAVAVIVRAYIRSFEDNANDAESYLTDGSRHTPHGAGLSALAQQPEWVNGPRIYHSDSAADALERFRRSY